MAKKKKAAREASAAVSCSRYTSPPVTLRVGSDLESYYVPEVLLQALNDLSRSEATEPTIDLPDVDVDTGHIIVHFLHTGQYQTLRNNEEETTPDYSKADFKKAIAAFIAAKKYGLTALQEVAKEQISECAESISVIQIAHGVGKDTLAALQEDAGWLQDLVLRKIEQTFKENDEIFSSASFFSGIKSLQLAKLCGQQVANLYCFQSRDVDKEVSELEKCEAKQGDLLRNWSGTEQADESAPTAQSDQAPVTGQASPPLPSVDEVPHDDWASFGFTKKKRKKARIALEEVPLKEPEPVAEPEPEPVLEPVMEAPSVEHIPVIAPHPVEEVVETTADNADVADPWASFDMSVSKKKKKKGKKIAVEEAPPPELYIPSQALEASESSPANVDSTSLNTWQDVPSVAPTEVIADVVLERATIVDDSPVIVEPPPTNEQCQPP
ncbi:hypothetical protein E8E11_004986 [Didymella keratinophila]|nr:hypothetical protein E8E11_004986 [Didymella keratinophila]